MQEQSMFLGWLRNDRNRAMVASVLSVRANREKILGFLPGALSQRGMNADSMFVYERILEVLQGPFEVLEELLDAGTGDVPGSVFLAVVEILGATIRWEQRTETSDAEIDRAMAEFFAWAVHPNNRQAVIAAMNSTQFREGALAKLTATASAQGVALDLPHVLETVRSLLRQAKKAEDIPDAVEAISDTSLRYPVEYVLGALGVFTEPDRRSGGAQEEAR